VSSTAESTLERFSHPRPGLFFLAGRPRSEATVPGDPWHSGARFIFVTWLPFAFLAIAQRLALGTWEPLFLQPNVHVRLLLSGPVCLVAQTLLDHLTGRSLECFVAGRYASDERITQVVSSATRWRDSTVLELLVFTLAFVTAGTTAWHGRASGLAGLEGGDLFARGAPYAFYAFVALPLYLFVGFRWLVRWCVWSIALVRLAQHVRGLPLAHPDGSAGLGHLTFPTRAFAIFAFANGCVMATTWSERIRSEGIHVAAFVPHIVSEAVVMLVIAFAPLAMFARPLFKARLEALVEYDELSRRYVDRFERRWLNKNADDDNLVGSPDIQSLSDLENVEHAVSHMRMVPFDRFDVGRVLFASATPMLLLVVTDLSLAVVLAAIGHAIVGRLAH
jgi:hypothetical protein